MLQAVLALGPVVLHTVAIYVFLIVVMRALGRRETSERSVTELVIVMVLGSAVETGLVAGDVSLPAGLASAAALLLCNRGFSLLQAQWPWLRRAMIGRAIPLVYDGRLLPVRLRQAGLTADDVRQGIRERGYEKLEQVRLAMLEIDGEISVVPREPASSQDGS